MTDVDLFADQSVAQILSRLAHDAPGLPALVFETGLWTRSELHDRITTVALWLLESKVTLGRMAGVAVADEMDHLCVTLALMSLNTPSISLPSFQPAERNFVLASLVGVSTSIVELEGQGVPGTRELVLPRYRELVHGAGSGSPPLPELASLTGAPACESLLYRSTSGTTGTPKTFGVSWGLIIEGIERITSGARESCVLRTSTIEHDLIRVYRVMAALGGRCSAIAPDLRGLRLADFCTRAGVTEILTGTYWLTSALQAAVAEGAALPAGTGIMASASRVPGPLRHEVLKRLTPDLRVGYALSEIGVVSIAEPSEHEPWPEGVGFPSAGVEVSIRDLAGDPVAPGMVGEAWIRKGRVRNPLANGEGGWFRTRDLLSWPSGSPLQFQGRSDDLMILNGINIFPAEIENCLVEHPGVAEVVAYGIASDRHGTIPAAAVVIAGGGEVDARELLKFARDRLGIRGPRIVHIVEEMPRTSSGKPIPSELPGADGQR